jgi:hypothetical protein
MGLDSVTSEIIDVIASVSPLYATTLAPVSGSVTLTGYYIDKNGIQVGALVTYTIAGVTTLLGLAGGSFPTNGNSGGAVGFTGVCSGALYVGAANALGTNATLAGGAKNAVAITNATNANPIVITAPAHGLTTTGQLVTIAGVLGNTNANGSYLITFTDANTFSLQGRAGNAAYTGGGTIAGIVPVGQNPGAGYTQYPAGNIVFGRDLPVPVNGSTTLGAGSAVVGGFTPTPKIDAANRLLSDLSAGSVITHTSKAAAGQLYSVYATNVNAAVRYLQIYDVNGSPSGTPIFSFPIPAGTAASPASVIIDNPFGPNGYYFANGITWAISTTNGTYTAGTPSDHNLNLVYL